MIQLVIVVVYLILMVLMGIATKKQILGLDDFFVAGRKQSAIWITGSLVAAIVGGSATIGMAGLGFTQGLTGAWWILVGAVGLIFTGLFLAQKVRGFALYTLPQLIEKQYGSRVALASSALIVVAWTGVVAGQIAAAGIIMSVMAVGNPTFWMVVFTAVFVGYTVLGGQYAVIRTDLIQAILIYLGIFSGLVVLLINLGGFSGLASQVSPDKFAFPLSSKFGVRELVSFLLIVGLTYVVGPDIYSRLFCSRDAKTARVSAFWTAAFLVPLAFAITLIGIAASAKFSGIAPEQAFPAVIKGVLSPFWGGLVIAALLSAIMSSADATALTASTILTVDVIGRIRPLSPKQTLSLSRCGVVAVGLISLLLALSLKGVINALLFAYTIYTCGLVLPVLAGFYKDSLRVTPNAALAAIIGGGATGFIGKLFGIKYLDLGGLAISGLLLIVVSLIEHRLRSKSRAAESSR